jgi:large subunit ribosomal protein L24
MGLHVKKNDIVVVLAGEFKGRQGKVLAAYPDKGRVLVEGVNVVHKAMRKSQDNPKGGIATKEAPIAASKVMLLEKFDMRRRKRPAAEAPAA